MNPHSSALSRFITAASRGLRELKSPWFAEMRTLRNEERVRRLLHGAGAPLFGGQKSKSKQKREMKEAKELDDPTPFFALDVPMVTYNGMTAGPLAMQVKNTKDFNEHVMAELTATNLEYMRIAVLQRAAEHDALVQRKAAEAAQALRGSKRTVFWREDRKAYIAKRTLDDGKAQYRTVRPRSNWKQDMENAKFLATCWAKGGENDEIEDVMFEQDDGAEEAALDDHVAAAAGA